MRACRKPCPGSAPVHPPPAPPASGRGEGKEERASLPLPGGERAGVRGCRPRDADTRNESRHDGGDAGVPETVSRVRAGPPSPAPPAHGRGEGKEERASLPLPPGRGPGEGDAGRGTRMPEQVRCCPVQVFDARAGRPPVNQSMQAPIEAPPRFPSCRRQACLRRWNAGRDPRSRPGAPAPSRRYPRSGCRGSRNWRSRRAHRS